MIAEAWDLWLWYTIKTWLWRGITATSTFMQQFVGHNSFWCQCKCAFKHMLMLLSIYYRAMHHRGYSMSIYSRWHEVKCLHSGTLSSIPLTPYSMSPSKLKVIRQVCAHKYSLLLLWRFRREEDVRIVSCYSELINKRLFGDVQQGDSSSYLADMTFVGFNEAG